MKPPKKGQPKYPYATMNELQAHAVKNKLTIAQIAMANEVSVSGKSEAEINAFLDKISTAMVNIVKSGLAAPVTTLPGPIKLKTKAGEVYKRAMDDKYAGQRGVGVVAPTRWPARRRMPAAISWSPPRPAALPASCRRSCTRSARAAASCRRRRSARDCSPPPSIGYLVQAQRDARWRRGRLPGGDRRGVRHGGGADRAGA